MVEPLVEQELSDGVLLGQYVQESSQEAFRQVVERHAGAVHRACLRQLAGNHSHADDATQATFILLADKADELLDHPSVAAWLIRSARYVAANLRRKEQRRDKYEDQVVTMMPPPPVDQDPNAERENLEEIRMHIDAVLDELPEKTRLAVVLHHLEGRPQREVAEVLGCSEEAAKKRIQYGVKRMRDLLSRRGVAATVPLLLILLTQEASAATTVAPGLFLPVLLPVPPHWNCTHWPPPLDKNLAPRQRNQPEHWHRDFFKRDSQRERCGPDHAGGVMVSRRSAGDQYRRTCRYPVRASSGTSRRTRSVYLDPSS